MKVLVTGGAGFIGSHVCERLVKEGCEVVCLDNLDGYYSPDVKRGNIRNMTGEKFRFIQADILDAERLKKIIREERLEYVIHEAAQAGVRASVQDPVKAFRVNVTGTVNLLEAVRDSSVGKTVFASSSSVYGKVEYLPFDEEHPKNPVSPYGASKLAAENCFRVYGQLYGIKYAALRYFTVYGPRIRPDLAISKFTKAALAGGELEVYGDGGKSRDFTHVSDAADATVKALRKGEGAYNIGGGTRITVKELAEKIIRTVGKGSIRYVEDQVGDVEHTESDTRKAGRELKWKPNVKFEDGLEETIKWVENIYTAGRNSITR